MQLLNKLKVDGGWLVCVTGVCFVSDCMLAVCTVKDKGCIESVASPIEKQEKQNRHILAEEEGSAVRGMHRSTLLVQL